MAIRVDDELLGYMRESSGAIHFEVRGASDPEMVVRALRQARSDLFSIPHPEEPADPYPSFASDVESGARGYGFWIDMADAEAYERVLEEALERVLAALAENGVEDACLTWPESDCQRVSTWRGKKALAPRDRAEAAGDPSPEPPRAASVARPDVATTGWSRCAPIPTVRSLLAATSGPDGRIYAIGGENRRGATAKTVEAYDPESNAWSRVASLQIGRRGPGAALGNDGRIYAIGGHGAERGGPRVPDLVITVEAYEPGAGGWENAAPIRAPALNHIGAATGRDGRIYALASRSAAYLPNVFQAYDPESESWTALNPPSAPAYRSGPWLVGAPDGRIYATGGTSFEGTVIVETYDPAKDAWEEVTSPRHRRGSFSAVGDHSGRIHLVGGLALDESATCPGEAYDPATDRWEETGPLPDQRYQLTATAGLDGAIYALGGLVEREVVGDVDVYRPA